MGRKLRTSIICGCAAIFLSIFPAEAGQPTPVEPSVEESQPQADDEMEEPDRSDDGESGNGESENESQETGSQETGSTSSIDSADMPRVVSTTGGENTEEGGESAGLLSQGNLMKFGIGAVLGAAAVGIAVFLRIGFAGRKEKQRQEDLRRQEEERRQVEQQCARGRKLKEQEEVRKRKMEAVSVEIKQDEAEAARGSIGKVHHIGSRRNQQDTMGTASTSLGFLAVVSDGMGGLSDGEKVSQKAVQGMLQAAGQASVSGDENPLFMMLSEANEQVLKMLGPNQIYKSGATLLAVLVNNGRFHWAAVGDSRIYLYCAGHLFQINREHIYKQQLIGEAVNKNISFSRVNTDPQRDRLVSFLGMGELKWVDGSLRPVKLKQGDKLLLMSDGIFNTISEDEIIRILESTGNAADAAARMEQQVLAAGNPKQDNFTCVILDF